MEVGVLGKSYSRFGVIPARYQSTRFPGKPLIDICGKPMIYWVSRQVNQCKGLDGYTVATDDERIKEVCEYYNIPVIMTPPTCINGTERVQAISKQIHSELYINIQGDEPAINPQDIDHFISDISTSSGYEFYQGVTPLYDIEKAKNPTIVKVVANNKSEVIYYSRSLIPFTKSKEPTCLYKCLGLYGYSKQFLDQYIDFPESQLEKVEGIEQLRLYEMGITIKMIKLASDSISVDIPDDLNRLLDLHKPLFI